MEPSKISVVIVSFFRAEQLRASLTALHSSGLQVIVVDQGSKDNTPDLVTEFPEVRFSRLPRNFGLTRALNIGIRAAEGEYLLLLHDDVQIEPDAVLALAEFLEARPDVAAVAPRLNTPQVRPLPGPSNPDPNYTTTPSQTEYEAECVSGASLMVRAAFLRSMGFIDERYGNYGSDIEICARIKSAGRKIIVLGNVPAAHGTNPSPMPATSLKADRITGTAAFLSKHHGFAAGLAYRAKSTLKGQLGASRIDGGQ